MHFVLTLFNFIVFNPIKYIWNWRLLNPFVLGLHKHCWIVSS